MRAKEYLGQIAACEKKEKLLKQQIEEMRAKAEGMRGISYDKLKIQASAVNRMEEDIAAIIDLTEDLHKLKHTLSQKKRAIINQIMMMPLSDDSQVLYLTHVKHYSLKKISFMIGYSYDHTRRIHSRALKNFERVYKSVLQDKENSQ